MSRDLRSKANLSPTALVVTTYARYSTDLQRDASIADQHRNIAIEIARQQRRGNSHEIRPLDRGLDRLDPRPAFRINISFR